MLPPSPSSVKDIIVRESSMFIDRSITIQHQVACNAPAACKTRTRLMGLQTLFLMGNDENRKSGHKKSQCHESSIGSLASLCPMIKKIHCQPCNPSCSFWALRKIVHFHRRSHGSKHTHSWARNTHASMWIFSSTFFLCRPVFEFV